mgnify:FL=1
MSEVQIGGSNGEEEAPMRSEIRSHFGFLHLGWVVGILFVAIVAGLVVGLTIN